MAGPQISATSDDSEQEKARQAQLAAKWNAELTTSEKAQQKWLTRARKIQKLYRRESSETDAKRKFAMLWSNTQTLLRAVYARPPQPVVSRRFKDSDPVGKAASEVLERSLSYSVDKQDLDGVLRTANLDFVLLARGQAWERYVPTFGDEIVPQIPVLQITNEGGTSYTYADGSPLEEDAEVKGEDGAYYVEGEAFQPVEYEESVTDYVNWEDFGFSPARTWDEVTYVWRRVYMDRAQLQARFGANLGKLIPLDRGPQERGDLDDAARLLKKAAIYEIWDKTSRCVYWISKSWHSRPLDHKPDPLGLDGFFPCPRPLLGTTTNDTLNPVPDYVYYQDQAEEIDILTSRIGELQDALKVRGFYAAIDKTNLNNLLATTNNTLIPVVDWMSLKSDGGVRAMIEWMPTDMVVGTLKACVELRAQIIEDVYQITGVSDILRGASDPSETAKAQGIKAQWGSLRIRDRQNEIARFARDIMRIKGEVIAEHFSTETLVKMTGLKLPTDEQKAQAQAALAQMQQAAQQAGQQPQVPPQLEEMLKSPTWEDVQALLKDNATRQFRVDIETDSTIEPNETEEKQATVELMTAMGGFMQQWGPVIQMAPGIAPLAAELLKFSLRRFRAGRQMEDVVETTMNQLLAGQGLAPQAQEAPSGPSQEQLQIEAQKVQSQAQTDALRAQTEAQRTQADIAYDQADIMLRRGDQQLKLVALNRDPNPQAVS